MKFLVVLALLTFTYHRICLKSFLTQWVSDLLISFFVQTVKALMLDLKSDRLLSSITVILCSVVDSIPDQGRHVVFFCKTF